MKLSIPLTNKCNNNCLFCVAKCRYNKGELDFSAIKQILHKYKKKCNFVGFGGGEPTLLKMKLIKLVKLARALGYEGIEITTNGRLFSSKSFVNEFDKKLNKEKENISITFSIHGPNSIIHDYLTQTNGSFHQTIIGLRNLVVKDFKVYTRSVITKQNLNELIKMLKIFIELGSLGSTFVYPTLLGKAITNFNLVIPKLSKIKPVVKKLLLLKKRIKYPISLKNIPFCLLKKIPNLTSSYCNNSQKKISILPITSKKFIATKDIPIKKSKICVRCKFERFCPGVDAKYEKKYKNEVASLLNPVAQS